MKILLIDDDAAVVDNLALYLRAEFHVVESLTKIKDKAFLFKQLNRFNPQGVVLDYGMPRPGTEVYAWIREWKSLAAIVFYTNYAHSLERAHMLRVGAKEAHILEKREVGLDLDAILEALRSQI